jgi:hypothetical protein
MCTRRQRSHEHSTLFPGHNIADVAAEAASFSINTETIAVAIKELDKCLKVTDNSGALSAALSAGAAAGVTGVYLIHLLLPPNVMSNCLQVTTASATQKSSSSTAPSPKESC